MNKIEVTNCTGEAKLLAKTSKDGGFYVNNEDVLNMLAGQSYKIFCLNFSMNGVRGVDMTNKPMEWSGGELVCPLLNSLCISHIRNPDRKKA